MSMNPERAGRLPSSLSEYKEKGYFVAEKLFPRRLTDAVLDEYKLISKSELESCGLPVDTFETIEGFGNNLAVILKHSVEKYIACCKLCQLTFSAPAVAV